MQKQFQAKIDQLTSQLKSEQAASQDQKLEIARLYAEIDLMKESIDSVTPPSADSVACVRETSNLNRSEQVTNDQGGWV